VKKWKKVIKKSVVHSKNLTSDVLVAGGGISGISAALAAARAGAKVLLAEKQCLLGGLATLGLITYYLPLCDGNGHQMCYGIAEELLRLSISEGGGHDIPIEWLENGTQEERKNHRFKNTIQSSDACFISRRTLDKKMVFRFYLIPA